MSQKKKGVSTALKKLPEFKNENAEREFWNSHDSTDYINWPKAERVTTNILLGSPSFIKKIS